MTVTAPSPVAGRITTATRLVPRPGARGAGARVAAPVRVRSRVVTGAPSCVRVAPQPIAASSTVQLTRRGWALLLGVAVAVAAVLVWIAYLSHPAATTPVASAPTQVTVHSGDTLWSIASRIAPDRDPREVVWSLQQANHLSDPTVVPGQVLRVG